MVTQIFDNKSSASSHGSAPILKLVQHRAVAGDTIPPLAQQVPRDLPRDSQLAATSVHQPTATECYGCVDWFGY